MKIKSCASILILSPLLILLSVIIFAILDKGCLPIIHDLSFTYDKCVPVLYDGYDYE